MLINTNIEKHRGYITTHRVDVSYSALFAAMEDQFISIAEGKDNGHLKETLYKMNKKEFLAKSWRKYDSY